MKVFITAMVVLALVALPSGWTQNAKDEHALLQGAWRVESSKDAGKEDPSTRGFIFTFQDGKLTAKEGDKIVQGSYKLDASKSPKWINVTLDKTTFLGIYELMGDTLKICHGKPNDERANEFASTPDSSNRVLTILKREKK